MSINDFDILYNMTEDETTSASGKPTRVSGDLKKVYTAAEEKKEESKKKK